MGVNFQLTNIPSLFPPGPIDRTARAHYFGLPKLTITGDKGSVAEQYAKKAKIPFSSGKAKPKKVSITQGTKATVFVGDKLTLTAKVAPATADSSVTWSSSNTKVATVSKTGVVKALKKGTATITAKTANGLKATCKITVPTPPKTIKLNKTKAKVSVGGELTLKATITPSGAKTTLTWSSSNTKVATVTQSGAVKALKKGTVTITVKTSNGLNAKLALTVTK